MFVQLSACMRWRNSNKVSETRLKINAYTVLLALIITFCSGVYNLLKSNVNEFLREFMQNEHHFMAYRKETYIRNVPSYISLYILFVLQRISTYPLSCYENRELNTIL